MHKRQDITLLIDDDDDDDDTYICIAHLTLTHVIRSSQTTGTNSFQKHLNSNFCKSVFITPKPSPLIYLY